MHPLPLHEYRLTNDDELDERRKCIRYRYAKSSPIPVTMGVSRQKRPLGHQFLAHRQLRDVGSRNGMRVSGEEVGAEPRLTLALKRSSDSTLPSKAANREPGTANRESRFGYQFNRNITCPSRPPGSNWLLRS